MEALEDVDLYIEMLDWQRCLMVGLVSQKVGSMVWQKYREAQTRRNEQMLKVIDSTLGEGEAGVLFITEEHSLQFPVTMQVFYVAPGTRPYSPLAQGQCPKSAGAWPGNGIGRMERGPASGGECRHVGDSVGGSATGDSDSSDRHETVNGRWVESMDDLAIVGGGTGRGQRGDLRGASRLRYASARR